jgi:hypothetical protein
MSRKNVEELKTILRELDRTKDRRELIGLTNRLYRYPQKDLLAAFTALYGKSKAAKTKTHRRVRAVNINNHGRQYGPCHAIAPWQAVGDAGEDLWFCDKHWSEYSSGGTIYVMDVH